MRVAFFGGTFDPIHRGHLAIASAAADAFTLDRLLFVPTGRQPLKFENAVASYEDRVAMVALACGLKEQGAATGAAPTPIDMRFEISRIDAPKKDGTPNYTVDALAELSRLEPQADLFAIAGADSFLTMRKWRSPDRLLNLAEWIVVSRPGFSLTGEQLAPLALTPTQRARVHLLTTVNEDVSATELRRRLSSGDPCTELLPGPVAEYIQAHHLYR